MSFLAATAVSGAGFVLARGAHAYRLGAFHTPSLLFAYLFNAKVRRLAAALYRQDPHTDVLATVWDTNSRVLLSRRLFREVDMDGVRKYAYTFNLRKLSFFAGAGDLQWKMETVDTPDMRDTLRDIDTTYFSEASYDEHGFRRADPGLSTGCERHVLFLGDSFTDGLWVKDGETFANVYARIARDRSGRHVCPVNAGVNGYGSFEERFVLEHEFDRAGRPSLIFVMYFPNDVDQDYTAVLGGTLPDAARLWRQSLDELRRMKRLASRHGAAIVLVAIPTAEQFFERQPQTHYQDVLRAFAAEEGIPFVNLHDGFAAANPRELYWPWDAHFTPAGHRVAAELLYGATRDLLQ